MALLAALMAILLIPVLVLLFVPLSMFSAIITFGVWAVIFDDDRIARYICELSGWVGGAAGVVFGFQLIIAVAPWLGVSPASTVLLTGCWIGTIFGIAACFAVLDAEHRGS